MEDQSNLDKKYFIDDKVYNCPYCNRRNVQYTLTSVTEFNWNNEKKCYSYLVQCSSCRKISMHLSYKNIYQSSNVATGYIKNYNFDDVEIDENIFYSVPTSFFSADTRIPKILRELITEGEGCVKMNFLTGASACIRKSIYEFLIIEKAEGGDYKDKIKSLKSKYPKINQEYFDALSSIQGITSDKIHEASWEDFDSEKIYYFIELLITIYEEIYVKPKLESEKFKKLQEMQQQLKTDKKQKDLPPKIE